jgi:hypothetical protein
MKETQYHEGPKAVPRAFREDENKKSAGIGALGRRLLNYLIPCLRSPFKRKVAMNNGIFHDLLTN